ncbi:MAG: hypothetical protein MPEBLZ_01831 [Candidatus Methanoperedens nitroreducens]|uniref:Uncharacterized protein n=1 Tax=Candidatus Methanoperedens nitratireducens TaxID=1392998 RepID=A0A0P7ZIQ4_9EURY|nr:hypothetical protein [Candidatus Methanoperedens sp. BLZ2]KAB2948428.1 MAG: hypothetical protein F9K14_00945 [Candidatus Methanoperedens sp.]KPQ43645.1 MAG: hypothetical protein MPEBLZ_01831 [Candidatus Methanoperedens sp. BLZ1]MBZ0174479.1 hypothetical protein [Candidatus Methanoperedens nitroreducens]CAG0966682.1 hypothetical protein METP2_01136 [Methanosarcinales archaeon]MCX9078501.1 hypothetical protein [Candidatus Methanoperedens sp.]
MQQEIYFSFDEKRVKDISKSIASEVANRIYDEFLLARYIPEIISIEKGSVVPIKTEDFKKQIAQRIKSMAE